MKDSLVRSLWQIQLTCAGAALALFGCKLLIDYATENESLPAAGLGFACVLVLAAFLLHLRKIIEAM